jgi:hypothetical protein
MNKSSSLRETMPATAAFIDVCRETFGKESVDAAIRAARDGQKTFHASENGIEFGTRDHDFDDIPNSISLGRMKLYTSEEIAQIERAGSKGSRK